MPNRALDEAISALADYYSLATLESITGEITRQALGDVASSALDLKNRITRINEDDSIVSQISRLVSNISTGGLTTPELRQKLEELLTDTDEATVESIFKMTDGEDIASMMRGPDSDAEVNSNPSRSSKVAPTMSVQQIRTARISPAARNANAVSLFLNSIPTIEMSRCVPYLDVRFIVNHPAVDPDTNRLLSLSLIKFLDGAADVGKNDSPNAIMANSLSGSSDPGRNATMSGMELFTSPQTLVPGDATDNPTLRSAKVIDKFRPLMSIDRLQIDVQPTTGIMSYKTARLEITLHDRSRLAEIADAIKPDMYSQTEVMLEYGWSHPDKRQVGNVYADLLNSLRCKEKYGIRNSSFNFDNAGQAKITVELFMKGGSELQTTHISEGDGVQNAQQRVNKLQEIIATHRNRVFRNNLPRGLKEVRGTQILDAAQATNGLPTIPKDTEKKIKEFLGALSDNPTKEAGELAAALEELFGTDGTDGAVQALRESIVNGVNRKMQLIVRNAPTKSYNRSAYQKSTGGTTNRAETKTRDSEARRGKPLSKDERAREKSSTDQNIASNRKQFSKQQDVEAIDSPDLFLHESKSDQDSKVSNRVTLGKIMLIFLGKPLASLGKFDDIQFLFYGFNSNAGSAHTKNISEFELDMFDFKRKFTDAAIARRSPNMQIQEFVAFLSNNFIDDMSNENYGLTTLFEPKPDKNGKKQFAARFADNAAALNTALEDAVKKTGVRDGIFKMPQIDVHIECVTGVSNEAGDTSFDSDAKSILRLHIFDKTASAYEGFSSILSMARDEEISTLGDQLTKLNDDPNDHKLLFNKAVTQAARLGLIERVDPDRPIYRFAGAEASPRKLKAFISNTVPNIIFGSNASMITDAGLRTIQDPRLNTVNMLRAGNSSPLAPNGSGQGGLPLQVLPTQMDVKMVGCPLIWYGQQFFVDFGTGTTVDNIYSVTGGFKHVIEQGKFDTTIKMINTDAWGKYKGVLQSIEAALAVMKEDEEGGAQGGV